MRAMRPRADHPRLLRGAVATMILMVALLAIATAAQGQTAGARFTYEQCDSALPGGAPPAYTFHNGGEYQPFQSCAVPAGAVGVNQTGQSGSSGWIEVGIPAPPGGFVEAATITAFLQNLPSGGGGGVAIWNWPADNGGDTPRYFFFTSETPGCYPASCNGTQWFDATLACSTFCERGATIGAHYIAATEVDPVPPVVGKVEGPLVAGGVLRGHQPLAATATDVGGGLSLLETLVNGTPAPGAAVPGTCAVAWVNNPSYQGEVAYTPSPCPAALAGNWDLNTAEYPFHEGANSVQVCASDFATTGPANTTCSPVQRVDVNNSCSESAVAGGQNLNVGVQGAGGEAVTVAAEQPAEVDGELTSDAGDPISGATICVQARVQESGTEPQAIATETTDARGDFSYEVAPGPNRSFLLGYRHDAFQVAKTIEVNADAKPTIELSKGRVRRGGQVKITGALPGPQAAGRVVVLQASSLHGARWLTFRRATTGAKGGFRSGYRFGQTSSTTTYRMRAVVPRQAGYPYEPGHSDPKRVKVLGPGASKKFTKHTPRREKP